LPARIHDPSGTQIAAGLLSWHHPHVERDLAEWLADAPPGDYRLELTVGTDESPFGPLTAGAQRDPVKPAARPLSNWRRPTT
jgi:hypothetical protein